jgi:hypothetical protein
MRISFSFFLLVGLAGASLGAPPSVSVSPTGEVTIKSGVNLVTVKTDGSVIVKGPSVDLSFPGGNGPAPEILPNQPDPLHEIIGTLYGSLQEEGKEAKVRELQTTWLKAVSLVDKVETLGELTTKLKAVQTLRDDDLIPIRERIRDEIGNILGKDPKATLDKAKARALFSRIAAALEKAVS